MMLLTLLAKTSVICLASLILICFCKHRSAAVRHLILAATFGVLLALPVATAVLPPTLLRVSVPIPARTFEDARPAPEASVRAEHASLSPEPHADGSAASQFKLSTLLMAAWLLGTVVFLGRTAAGLWQLRCLRRDAISCAVAQTISDKVAADAGIRRRLDVLQHDDLDGPLTFGVVRPAIMLPNDAQSWDRGDLVSALAHEIEHVRRHDWLIQCIARVIYAVYWFHPLVYLCWRALRFEAECACDDAVLARHEPTEYAALLVEIAQRQMAKAQRPVLAMASRSDLKQRVAALLDSNRHRSPVTSASVAATIVVAAVFVASLASIRAVDPADITRLSAPDPQAERFEVATIKLVDRSKVIMVGVTVSRGGRAQLSGMSLKALVSTAYEQGPWQISNRGESWIDQELYNVEAKASESSKIANSNYSLFGIDDPRLRQMLQALLLDRFQLKLSSESSPGDVYQLIRTDRALKLSVSKMPEGTEPIAIRSNIGYVGGRWSMMFMPMAQLATFAARYVRAPVSDLTSLGGRYNYEQTASDDEPSYTGVEHTDSFLRMIHEIGLELKRTRGVVTTLVIQSASRPSPN